MCPLIPTIGIRAMATVGQQNSSRANDSASVSHSTTIRHEVAVFDGTGDFSLWKVRMKYLLVKEGVAKALKGMDAIPGDNEAVKEEINERALGTLFSGLSDKVLRNVVDLDTAKGVWEKLKSLYMAKSLTNRLYLRGKLHTFRMAEGTSLKDHLDEYNKLLLDLSNIGVEVDEEDKALILIYSLPKSFEHITTTMLYGKETISLEEVEATLLSNELRLKVQLQHQVQTPAQGLIVRGRDEQKKGGQGRSKSKTRSKSRSRRPGVCHYCKKPGHWKSECRLLQSKKEREQKDKGTVSDSATVAVSSAGHNSNDNDAVFTAACSVSHPDTWIVDSGASFHMTPHREWFSSFRSCEGGTVLLGDDGICKVEGVGIVQIKSNANTVVTLDDVRYVPQLKRNLLSGHAFDSASFEGRCGRGSITINKGW